MSVYQKSVWVVKGLREFTKSGYETAAKNFNANDLKVDVTGRHYMITGANSGIGKAAAIEVARCGGTVHMVCRSKERADEAKAEIVSTSGNSNVHVHILDMSEPRSVWQFAGEFSGSGKQLDVLVNNAGCMINERKENADGLEMNFLTNVLGTYILTVGLLPALQKSSRPQVIVVTSGGMLTQKLNVADLQHKEARSFDGTMVYAQHKRQQVVIIEEMATKYPDVHWSCMHPGWADTPAVRTSMPGFYERMKTRLRTAAQGADTLSWLCLADAVKNVKSGEYFQDRKAVSKHLPLAWTKASAGEKAQLVEELDRLAAKYRA